MRKRRGGGDGSRRKGCTAIIRCRLEFFWEAWRCSHSFSATSFCTGTEGSGEDTGKPGGAARDRGVGVRDVRVHDGLVLHPRAAKKHCGGKCLFVRTYAVAGDVAAAPVQHGDPATEAAEARTAGAIKGRAAAGANQRELQPRGAFESFLWRARVRDERTGEDSEPGGQGDSGFCIDHGNGRGRHFSRRAGPSGEVAGGESNRGRKQKKAGLPRGGRQCSAAGRE